ncbi:MAG: hypothetical protein ABIP94_10375, partial [Planctomycetota bacterium]
MMLTPDACDLTWRRGSPHLPFLALLVAACSGGGGSGGDTAPVVPSGLLAAARIGPAGGQLAVTSGPHAGVMLTVPQGSVAAPTDFSIRLDAASDSVPSLFPVYVFEPANI